MKNQVRWTQVFSLMHDGLVGGLLLLWPGLWHELLHGQIERTTFYLPQALGAVLLCRAVLALLNGRSPDVRIPIALGSLWAAQVVICLSLVFRLGVYDSLVASSYVFWAVLSGLISSSFIRSSSVGA